MQQVVVVVVVFSLRALYLSKQTSNHIISAQLALLQHSLANFTWRLSFETRDTLTSISPEYIRTTHRSVLAKGGIIINKKNSTLRAVCIMCGDFRRDIIAVESVRIQGAHNLITARGDGGGCSDGYEAK